jgi:hypothetical protein
MHKRVENVVVNAINLAQCSRLLIALSLLNLVCHISFQSIGMRYDDQWAVFALNSNAIYVTSLVHIQCV